MKIITLFFSLFLLGCSTHDIKYVHSTCPTFNKTLDINITRYDDERAILSWSDVQKLSDLAEAKHKFNEEVTKMNTENSKKFHDSLKD